ncbi:PREDICTED: O-acetyl-ADP-ribose deacetylase MACROD2-like isoform X2 [Ceratosolen solmsi marchali]|nr:PREDICTED: O-acetyl-ADP-ribose deacetylase MACROD2-like isoform X2 [Ceratosolen solmsi marchali]
MAFEAEKKKYLSMSLNERRQLYKGTPKTIEQILTWPDYFETHKLTMAKLSPEESVEKVSKGLADKISIWGGDICQLEVDVIVNAANTFLCVGGGVDGAIHKAAGPYLQKECTTLGGCRIGEAKLTGGYRLPAKYVIQTVGPREEIPENLQDCYKNSLDLAQRNGLRSIAFPCIATGIYGYPPKAAATIALSTVKKFLLENPDIIHRVIFCLYMKNDIDIYEELLQKYYALE